MEEEFRNALLSFLSQSTLINNETFDDDINEMNSPLIKNILNDNNINEKMSILVNEICNQNDKIENKSKLLNIYTILLSKNNQKSLNIKELIRILNAIHLAKETKEKYIEKWENILNVNNLKLLLFMEEDQDDNDDNHEINNEKDFSFLIDETIDGEPITKLEELSISASKNDLINLFLP